MPFQPLFRYECSLVAWEQRIAARVRLPAHGYTALYAAPRDPSDAKAIVGRLVDCRYGAPYSTPEIPARQTADQPFVLDNGLLRLEFADGNIKRVFDSESKEYVLPDTAERWNELRLERIDADNAPLHAGPVTEKCPAEFKLYTITASGPVVWEVSLEGTVAGMPVTQTITLYAGQRALYFRAELDFTENRGRLAAAIPVGGDLQAMGRNPLRR